SSRPRDLLEVRELEEAITSIRLRTQQDAFEEWEADRRTNATRSARLQYEKFQSHVRKRHHDTIAADLHLRAQRHDDQMAQVQSYLNDLRLEHQRREEQLKKGWEARASVLWQHVEAVIAAEEKKVQTKLDEERRARHEAEALRRKEEEQVQRENEAAEAQRRSEQLKRQEEEERRRKDVERHKAHAAQREQLGLTTPMDDWLKARQSLVFVKSHGTSLAKQNPEMKSKWGELRRAIVPKIGQLIADDESIHTVTRQLVEICQRALPPETPVFVSVLSSLAKSILLQAETEVTAEKRSAMPLARVTLNLLRTVPHFNAVFHAKLVQRVGGWSIPIFVPPKTHDNKPWKDDAQRFGYRRYSDKVVEDEGQYTSRVAGIMRVYFLVLTMDPMGEPPQSKIFHLNQYWIWFGRLMSERKLLSSPVAAQLLYVALEVFGSGARQCWGRQWLKMLSLLYDVAKNGYADGKQLGGTTPEGRAGCGRVLIEIERIIKLQ
ncbi:hypothetical protein FISHEDRAFT_51335, partial [Fistulina hepatica ATCC 64428]